MADRDEAPPIAACRLYEKTSKAGNIYLTAGSEACACCSLRAAT